MVLTLNRRQLIRLLSLTPLVAAACGDNNVLTTHEEGGEENGFTDSPPSEIRRLSTATPEPPFVLPLGEERRLLMPGTRYETPLYIFGTGRPGRIGLVLGGVHGNEPGGWLAAERAIQRRRPANGALLVIPRANVVAINLLERTTDALGDLNRSYPGFEDGRPMELMAGEVVKAIRD